MPSAFKRISALLQMTKRFSLYLSLGKTDVNLKSTKC